MRIAGVLLAADPHQRHAGNLADPLGEYVLGGVVDIDDRGDLGRHRQDQDGRVGRVDLAIGRGARQVLRQLAGRRVDRRLDVIGGSVNIAVEIELDGDRGRAERARRGHLGDARDLSDLALKRLGDRRRHGLRRSPRERGRNRDRRKIDLRQRRDGERRKRDEAHQEDRNHDQRGGDRTVDKGCGNAAEHSAQLPLALSMETSAPGCSKNSPAVTTRSPSWRPSETTAVAASWRATFTCRTAARLSSPTT